MPHAGHRPASSPAQPASPFTRESLALMYSRMFLRHAFVCWILIPLVLATGRARLANADDADAASTPAEIDWDIENPPGPQFQQAIDTTEGTWINVDVSPDGSEVVFDLLGDLYVMPISGADGTGGNYPRKLTQGVSWDMQPRFRPDGAWIAFTSDRAGSSKRAGDNLWLIRREGSELRQVTNETYRLVNGPAWSPDGQYLVGRKHFTSRRSLGAGEMWLYHWAAADAKAMSGVQLTERPNDQKDVNEPSFSPDGRYLYYSQDTTPGDSFEYDKDSNQQIYVIRRLDLVEGQTQSFVTGPGGACRPTPSPDGTRLAFVRRVGAKTGLHILDLKSGAIRLIYDQLERDMQEAWAIHGVYPSFAWTPDSQDLVIWAKGKIRRINSQDGSSSVIPFLIRDQRQLTQRVRFTVPVAPTEFPVRMLRWVVTSPTGNQVAYQALGQIYVRDLPDGVPRRLTSQNEHFEFFPSYSRDGRYLVYTTWDDDELGSIRIASVAGEGGQENWKVTSEPGHYLEPVFSPDGATVVYVKSSGGYIRSPLYSRDTGLYQVGSRGGDARADSPVGIVAPICGRFRSRVLCREQPGEGGGQSSPGFDRSGGKGPAYSLSKHLGHGFSRLAGRQVAGVHRAFSRVPGPLRPDRQGHRDRSQIGSSPDRSS